MGNGPVGPPAAAAAEKVAGVAGAAYNVTFRAPTEKSQLKSTVTICPGLNEPASPQTISPGETKALKEFAKAPETVKTLPRAPPVDVTL